MNNFVSVFEELNKLYEEEASTAKKEEAPEKEELTEAAEDAEIEMVDDEAPAETEVPAEEDEEEPRQIILECDKCGALVLRDEADVVIDEESDLVNVEDKCEFCEETAGYKIIGVVAPYNPEEVEMFTEDLADWYRRKFDKPASVRTQQAWEDELNGEMGEISDKRRKHLERKFAQQRDWEARHTASEKNPELEELFDAKLNVDAQNFAGDSNKVSVLGLESFDAKEAEDEEDLDELFDAKINLDARGFGGSGNDVKVL